MRQAGTLRAFPPAGMQMMLALWGIFTFMLFVQTLVMNIALQACRVFHCLRSVSGLYPALIHYTMLIVLKRKV